MPPRLPSIAFRWLLLPCVVVMVALSATDAQLKTPHAPRGIVSLELCAVGGSCVEILREWTPPRRERAMFSLGLDYLFLVLYPAVIASGLLLLAGRMSRRFARPTKMLAWLMIAAGIADAVENYLLVRLLSTGQIDPFAFPAALFATAKFALVGLALLWLAIGFLLTLRARRDA